MGRRPALRSEQRVEESKSSDQPRVFCTECGATLENFCFSSRADDLEAIRKTLAQCKQQGRFSGDFCAKLFIAHPDIFEDFEDNK